MYACSATLFHFTHLQLTHPCICVPLSLLFRIVCTNSSVYVSFLSPLFYKTFYCAHPYLFTFFYLFYFLFVLCHRRKVFVIPCCSFLLFAVLSFSIPFYSYFLSMLMPIFYLSSFFHGAKLHQQSTVTAFLPACRLRIATCSPPQTHLKTAATQ